ncbi:MAG: hypothetical protein KDB86_00990 [Actinobacteria bacterium]|nr:hypothetical protein [Actinomycetota bacterium]
MKKLIRWGTSFTVCLLAANVFVLALDGVSWATMRPDDPQHLLDPQYAATPPHRWTTVNGLTSSSEVDAAMPAQRDAEDDKAGPTVMSVMEGKEGDQTDSVRLAILVLMTVGAISRISLHLFDMWTRNSRRSSNPFLDSTWHSSFAPGSSSLTKLVLFEIGIVALLWLVGQLASDPILILLLATATCLVLGQILGRVRRPVTFRALVASISEAVGANSFATGFVIVAEAGLWVIMFWSLTSFVFHVFRGITLALFLLTLVPIFTLSTIYGFGPPAASTIFIGCSAFAARLITQASLAFKDEAERQLTEAFSGGLPVWIQSPNSVLLLRSFDTERQSCGYTSPSPVSDVFPFCFKVDHSVLDLVIGSLPNRLMVCSYSPVEIPERGLPFFEFNGPELGSAVRSFDESWDGPTPHWSTAVLLHAESACRVMVLLPAGPGTAAEVALLSAIGRLESVVWLLPANYTAGAGLPPPTFAPEIPGQLWAPDRTNPYAKAISRSAIGHRETRLVARTRNGVRRSLMTALESYPSGTRELRDPDEIMATPQWPKAMALFQEVDLIAKRPSTRPDRWWIWPAFWLLFLLSSVLLSAPPN